MTHETFPIFVSFFLVSFFFFLFFFPGGFFSHASIENSNHPFKRHGLQSRWLMHVSYCTQDNCRVPLDSVASSPLLVRNQQTQILCTMFMVGVHYGIDMVAARMHVPMRCNVSTSPQYCNGVSSLVRPPYM